MMSTPSNDDITVVPLRGIRGMIADKMQKSLQESAQLTHHADCDVSVIYRRKQKYAEAGAKVSIEDVMIEAVVDTLGRHPDLNGTVIDREIHLCKAIHVSVAMALPGNLLVAPAIFDAHEKSLEDLRTARQDLAARAVTNKLTVTEMTGGTFTISNLGVSRVHHFTPILNTPQIAVLGIGCARQQAVETENGAVEFRSIVGLSLTFDHRAVDGAPAADFLTDLCRMIEAADP